MSNSIKYKRTVRITRKIKLTKSNTLRRKRNDAMFLQLLEKRTKPVNLSALINLQYYKYGCRIIWEMHIPLDQANENVFGDHRQINKEHEYPLRQNK